MINMKTITFFANLSLESPNGVGRYFPIAKELVKKGYKINIIVLHHHFSSLKQKEFVKDGVNVYYVGQMQVLKIGDEKKYLSKPQLIKTVFLSTLKMCLKGLRLKTDIIYLFKPQPIAGTAALITKLIKGKKFFIDCDDYEAQSNTFSSKIEKFIFSSFENILPKFADKITVHNSFLIQRYISLGIDKQKILFLPNGVDIQRFQNLNEQEIHKLKHRFNLRDKKIVLYFGSLSLKSGHSIDLLLKSFVTVEKKIKNVVLLLVGGGEDINLLRNYTHDLKLKSVIFVGRVDSAEIPGYIRLADVTVDPVYDTPANKARSPLKVFESMALGVPVVTGDVGDRKPITKNGKTGVLVKPGDEKELAKGIIRVLLNKDLATNMSKQSLKTIKEYQWDELVKKLDNSIT